MGNPLPDGLGDGGWRGDRWKGRSVIDFDICSNVLEEKNWARQAETAPVTVEQSRERQEVIAAANTAGKKYYAMGGGMHSTTDDGFIALEINLQTSQVAELEREKKSRTVYHVRRDAAIPIFDHNEYELEGNHTKLCGKELEVLLKWKGVAASKMKTILDKRTLFQKFVDDGTIGLEDKSSIPAWWTDANEARLNALQSAPIELGDTVYGRHEAEKKKDGV